MKYILKRFVFMLVASTTLQTVAALSLRDVQEVAGMALFFLSLVLLSVFVVFLIKECVRKLDCFNKRRNPSEPEPVYDEVEEGLKLSTLPPPSLPIRPVAENAIHTQVPAEYAPGRPEEPEYIIPEEPDYSLNPDGYLRPIK